MDNPAVIAVGTSTLIVLVAILTIDGIVIGATFAPVTASIFNIDCAICAVGLTGITPVGIVLRT